MGIKLATTKAEFNSTYQLAFRKAIGLVAGQDDINKIFLSDFKEGSKRRLLAPTLDFTVLVQFSTADQAKNAASKLTSDAVKTAVKNAGVPFDVTITKAPSVLNSGSLLRPYGKTTILSLLFPLIFMYWRSS